MSNWYLERARAEHKRAEAAQRHAQIINDVHREHLAFVKTIQDTADKNVKQRELLLQKSHWEAKRTRAERNALREENERLRADRRALRGTVNGLKLQAAEQRVKLCFPAH